jgi:SNF2 family DNA or RNA helicase
LEETDALLVVDTYYGLMRMVCETVPPTKKKKKDHLTISSTQVARLMKGIDGLIMDESTTVKNRGKLPFRVCRQISKRVGTVFALSGTPFGRDPIDLWAQMFLVDQGETLGPTLGLFRECFFKATENYWGGFKYDIDKNKMGLLNRTLANRSLRYVAATSDLPKLVSIVKHIKLPHDARTYYERAYDQLKKSRGNIQESKNAFLRLRQISSGFLGYRDDELGIRAELEFPENPKLDLLLSVIESIPTDRKILVFHDFIFSGSIISRELTEMGVKHVRLYHKTKNQDELLRQFAQHHQLGQRRQRAGMPDTAPTCDCPLADGFDQRRSELKRQTFVPAQVMVVRTHELLAGTPD